MKLKTINLCAELLRREITRLAEDEDAAAKAEKEIEPERGCSDEQIVEFRKKMDIVHDIQCWKFEAMDALDEIEGRDWK